MTRAPDDDFDREIRAHLECDADERVADGLSPDEARLAARRAFGNVTRVKEISYEMRRFVAFERVVQDLRFALRQTRKAPGFAIAVIATLALGIGVNTSVFTLLYATSLRALPLKNPDRLVNVFQTLHGQYSRGIHGSPDMLSYAEYLSYRDRSRTLDGLAAFADVGVSVEGAQTEAALGVLASCNYFQVLQVDMALGRAFVSDECRVPGDAPVAVLGHGFWQRRFSADPSIVGKIVRLNRRAFMIVGVAAPGFAGTELNVPDVWIPVTMQPLVRERPALDANASWLIAIGRLKQGVTIAQARADLTVIARQTDAGYPGRETRVSVEAATFLNGPQVRKQGLPVAGAILAAVGLVLLMACCNVMNLLLARAATRQREIGVRVALGAGRARLVQQLLTEATALALAGGAASLAIAYWVPPFLLQIAGQRDLRVNLTPDLHVFGYAFALSWIAALVFGLAPALWSTKVDVSSSLKQDRSSLGGAGASTLRSSLAAIQVAGSLFLLVQSALLIHGVRHAQTLSPGFATKDVLAIALDLPAQGYTPERATAFYRALRERLAGVAGVDSVALAGAMPLLSRQMATMTIDPAAGQTPVLLNVVSGDYFRTMQIRIVRGRVFTDEEAGATTVRPVIVSAALARRFWREGDELGRRITDDRNTLEIVGVADDAHHVTLGTPDAAFLYLPAHPDNPLGLKIVLRAPGHAAAVASVAGDLARSLDRNVLVTTERFEDRLARALQPSRVAAMLAASLGVFALLLALVGVYGVVSYSVSLRTREMGVRMALGALPRDIVGLVVWQGARPVAAGLIAGAILATGAARIIKGLLFGVSSLDPAAYLTTLAMLSAAAVLAMYLPARRAARVDPAVTLRFE